ncbi:MAG: alpha-L-fucosidase [bacterium]
MEKTNTPIKSRIVIAALFVCLASLLPAAEQTPAGNDSQSGTVILDPQTISKQAESPASKDAGPGPNTEPMARGPFQPSWESLKNYQCPEWFRDAKFGIFADWGPQCQPEVPDGSGWYARDLYVQGSKDHNVHLQKYGHPSKVGFKDVCNDWKGEKFDPDKLLALYQRAGAKYLVAMANHHDNFDLWDSTYQPWNSVNIGLKRNLIGDWAKATRAAGLRFGVSVHASPAWSWYGTSVKADTTGPLAGIPYDGNLTKKDGKGQWWEGLDPQDLYAQSRKPGDRQAYCDKFYNRTLDLINRYQPDVLYFDDRKLPLADAEAYGLRIAAHLYNSSITRNSGRNEAVMNTKGLDEMQQRCLVYDIERGRTDRINAQPWQTDTCIGNWFYDPVFLQRHKYRKAGDVVRLLCDVVSKNGNLLLSVPIRGNGELDADEIAILQDIGKWMNINGEAIYATRPWKTFGEGPSTIPTDKEKQIGEWRVKLNQLWDFRDGCKPYTSEDIRFTQSKDGKTLYAIVMGVPKESLKIKSLAGEKIQGISLLGSDAKLNWKQEADALVIQPAAEWPCQHTVAFKIELAEQ